MERFTEYAAGVAGGQLTDVPLLRAVAPIGNIPAMKKFSVFVALIYTAAVVGVLAWLSNWFRDAVPIQGSVVVLPLIISNLAVLLVAVFAFKYTDALFRILLVAVVIGSVVYIGNAHQKAYGTYLPSLDAGEVESSGIAVLNAHGQRIRYRLELHNAGAVTHREILVVVRGDKEQRIRLPLFDDGRSGHVSAKTPGDWIVLRPTSDIDVYDVDVGRFLVSQKSFQVNLKTGDVTTLAAKK